MEKQEIPDDPVLGRTLVQGASAPDSSGYLWPVLLQVREEVSSRMLGVLSIIGGIALLVYLPGMVKAGAFEEVGAVLVMVVVDIILAAYPRLPVSLRGGWVVVNFVVGGSLALLWGGDRGAVAAMYIGATLSATVLLGRRVAATVFWVATMLIAVVAWREDHGLPPIGGHLLSTYDLNSEAGWLGLWTLCSLVSVGLGLGIELMLRSLRQSTEEQIALSERAQATLQALLEVRERQNLLREQMLESELARFRTERALADALFALSGGFWETEMQTGVTTWSAGMYDLLGYTPGEVVPSLEMWRARTHPDDYEKMMSGPLQERAVMEYRALLPGGEIRYLRSSMSVVFDESGQPKLLRGLVTDNTEEHAQATRMARLAEIANRTANAVVITNPDIEIEWVNEAFIRLTGWNLPEVAGKNPGSFLQGPHTDPAARAKFRSAIQASVPFDEEILNYHRDGHQYWVRIEGFPTWNSDGRPSGYIAVETDITAQRIQERRDVLEQQIAAIFLECDDIQQASERVTQALVQELDIRLAQVWLVEPGNSRLVWLAGAAAESCGPAGQSFLECSQTLAFTAGERPIPGVGVPGVAWGQRRSFSLPLLNAIGPDGRRSRRAEVAEASGIHTFFATPVMGSIGVVGVIEIGGTSHYPGHELLPTLIERVASQLASFWARQDSRRAFEALFAGSPDALLLADIHGVVVGTNTRANRLFGEVVGRPLVGVLAGTEEALQMLRSMPSPSESSTDGKLRTVEAQGIGGRFWAEVSVALPTPNSPVGIISVRDLTERYQMEETIRNSLKEKELLLREIHHRVKNNLQIISSLLSLQARATPGESARGALEESVFRVRSMSLVHQLLYGNDQLDRIDIGEFTRRLAASLQQSLAPNAVLTLSAAHVDVPVDIAVPCGLVINEILTNSFKHGRSADGICTIRISVRANPDGFTLELQDDGPGLREGAEKGNTLGMKLIRSLVQQLHATNTLHPGPGCHLTLKVPLLTADRPAG